MSQKQEDKSYLINSTLLQNVVDYLGTRPASEVFNLLGQLLRLAEVKLQQPTQEVKVDEKKTEEEN